MPFFKVCEEDIWGEEPELEARRFFTSPQSEFMVVFVSVFKLYFVVCGGRKGPEDYFASEFWGVQRYIFVKVKHVKYGERPVQYAGGQNDALWDGQVVHNKIVIVVKESF